MFEVFRKSGATVLYYRIPISMLELIRSEMAKQNKFFKIRYRGPRFNVPSARFRGWNSKQSTCLKEDATHFSVYSY